MKENRQSLFYGYWIVAGCFVLLFLFSGAGFYSFGVFIKPFEDHFGWSRTEISLTISIYMIIHGLAGPFVGYITEKQGPKKVMTLFGLISGAAFILVSFTTSLRYLYLTYGLLALGSTGIGFIPVSSVLSRWFIRRRGTAIGSAMVGIAVGGLVMAPLTGLINAHFGWRVSFVVLGLLVWLLALPIAFFVIKGSPDEMGLLPDGDTAEGGRKEKGSVFPSHPLPVSGDGWPLREALKTRAFFWVAATYFLAPMAQMGMLQHLVPMVTMRGISEASAAMALGLTAGLGGLGKLSFGRISESIPFHYAASLCFGLQALAVFILFSTGSVSMTWVYVILFGFAMGGVIVLMPIAVGHFFGLAAFSVIMGVVSFLQALGTASGAFLSGLIYDTTGSYENAMVIYMIVYIAAIAAILLAGKPRAFQEHPHT
ncbi:MAG: MFS transporter [Desulfobacterales bacterium]